MRFAQPKRLVMALAAWIVLSPFAVQADQKADQQRCEALNGKMLSLYRSGKYAEAAKLGEELVKLAETAFGAETPDYATSLNFLAGLYCHVGEYAKAESLNKQGLEIRRKALGEEHPDYAASLNNLALLYKSMGEYAKAEPLYKQAMEIWRKALGEEHPDFTVSLNNLALLYYSMGENAQAEPLYKKAMEIRRKVLGEEHPHYATSLNNLAVLYESMGEYTKAEPLLKQALEIRRKALGEEHPDYAASLHNLAGLYRSMEEYAKAEPLYKQAMEIQRKALGEDHPDYAASLNGVALLYESMGEYAKAEPLYKQAMEICRKALGEEHPHFGASLNNLALLYYSMGEYTKAEPLLKQALEICRKALGEEHPSYAASLHGLAELYRSMGEYPKAEPLYKQAVEIEREALGEEHPSYAGSLGNYAVLCAAQERSQEAFGKFDEGLRALHAHTARVLAGLSESRQVHFLQRSWSSLAGFLSFVHRFPRTEGAVGSAAEWLARWKALAAEVQAERCRLLQMTADPRLRKLAEQLAAARAELARLTLSPPPKMKPVEVRQRRQAAEKRAADLESELAQQSAEFAQFRRLGKATLQHIAGAMPATAVLLDYARFRDFDFKAKGKEKRWGDWRYVVFITPAGKVPKPVMVDLGPAEPVDEAIAALRKAIDKVEKGQRPKDDKQIREMLMKVRKLVIDPALPHVRDKEHWIVCPDGQISLVPFECLPITGGRYLIEITKLSYLGAAREAAAYAGAKKQVEEVGRPVLLGDPDFNLMPEVQQAELKRLELKETGLAMRGVGGSRELEKVLFPALPATGPEVELAAKMVGGAKLLRRQALEGAVKRVSKPKILYLATHGFFLPDQEWTREDDSPSMMSFTARGMGPGNELAGPSFGPPGPRIENPLLRCGLALAGANRREEALEHGDVDDGILTGMEVAGLDLWGTQLVVLSACQTGLGDVKQGEGVMSLRRVFLLAGARRVMATLWMVPDKQTQELMGDFITRWQAGTPAVDALRESQIALITQMRKDHGHAHPFFWAAFTMTGDWR